MRVEADEGLLAYLAEQRERIDDALDRRVPPLGTQPAVLHEALRHALLSPGKRIRGTLVLATAEMLRGALDQALALACAVEMVHAASLILDDLPAMDDAVQRRGRPTLHRVVGEAQAILASVALLNRAYAVIQEVPGMRDRERAAATRHLTEAIGADGLIGGQAVDLESAGRDLDLDALEFIHSHKTGALFIVATQMGALVSRSKARDLQALQHYAKNLGLAFQITDDLLDYSGSPETTGKDAGGDRNKTTFVALCSIDGSRKLVDELIDASQAALAPFGKRSGWLHALAEYVRGRDR